MTQKPRSSARNSGVCFTGSQWTELGLLEELELEEPTYSQTLVSLGSSLQDEDEELEDEELEEEPRKPSQ